LWFKEFQSARKKRTKPVVARASEARGQQVSTAYAKAMSFVEADILSSPRHVPAGTLVILSENVRQFQKRSARIDRHMKVAKRNLAKIKKSLYIESDCDDASSSEEKRKGNPFACYRKNELIIESDLPEQVITKFLNLFGDDAKVNLSVSEFREFLANKLREEFPKYEEVVTKSMTILRYARLMHAGRKHDYLEPLQISSRAWSQTLDLADSISTSQIVSLTAQHQVSHGKLIFQLRLEVAWLGLPSPILSTSFDESSEPPSTGISGLQTKPLPPFEPSPALLLRAPPAMAPRAHGLHCRHRPQLLRRTAW